MGDQLKLPEVARRLGVSEKTARRYVKSGALPSMFIGNAYRVSEENLEKFIEASRVTAGSDLGKAPRRSPFEPSFNDVLEEERREKERRGAMDPTAAAATIRALVTTAEGLAAAWNQDVELYEQHGRDLQPYRTLEMGSAVVALYQQFWGALEALQRHAQQLGHSPDISAWEPQSKRLLLESGSSIRALAELYAVIDRNTAGPGANSDDFRAMRQEFDPGVPPALTSDPEWPAALEKARTAVGLAG